MPTSEVSGRGTSEKYQAPFVGSARQATNAKAEEQSGAVSYNQLLEVQGTYDWVRTLLRGKLYPDQLCLGTFQLDYYYSNGASYMYSGVRITLAFKCFLYRYFGSQVCEKRYLDP